MWIYLVIIVCFVFCVAASYLLKKKYEHHSIVMNWVTFLLSLSIVALLTVVLFSDNTDSVQFRGVVMVITAIIAAASLFTTIFFTNKTAKFNLSSHRTNLLVTLIKNNYSIVENLQKNEKSDTNVTSLLGRINTTFNKNEMQLEKATEAFYSDISRISPALLAEGVQSLETDFTCRNEKDVKVLSNVFQKKDAAQKLLITYYKQSQVAFFDGLPEKTKVKDIKESVYTTFKTTDVFQDIVSLINENSYYLNNSYSYDEVFDKMNVIYNDSYVVFGHFFRNTHRVVKLINEFYQDSPKEQKQFLGILRSQFSEDILLILYYNCVYTKKGLGLGRQLIKSDFFGDFSDLESGNYHFREEKLVFGKIDKAILQRIFVSNQNKLNSSELEDDQKIKEKISQIFCEDRE